MEEPILNSEFFAAHLYFFTSFFKFGSDPNTESTGGFYYTSIDGLGSQLNLDDCCGYVCFCSSGKESKTLAFSGTTKPLLSFFYVDSFM